MITLIIGGSSSGKSKYAEDLTFSIKNKLYIATMLPNKCDVEVKNKILAHKKMRKDKNFVTCEYYTCEMLEDCLEYDLILLECVSNLLANEMFSNGEFYPNQENKIISTIQKLATKTKHLVIVSNDIFHDGCDYDDFTLQYISQLGKINQKISKIADNVTEIVFSIPIQIKGCN